MNSEEKILKKLKIKHDIESMISFDNLNIQEELQKNPYYIMKYKELYIREQNLLDEIQSKYDELIGKRYHFYRFESDEKLTKTEIEKYYLPKDEKILKMKKIIRKQKVKVDFFDACYKAFEKRQWAMKTFSDNLRYGGI
jgi:hypothetical protein